MRNPLAHSDQVAQGNILFGYSCLLKEKIGYFHIPVDAIYVSLVPIDIHSMAIEHELTRTALQTSVPRIAIEEITQFPYVAFVHARALYDPNRGMD